MRINFSKTLSPVMFLLALSAVSCFDDKYDLKKDIDMTVTVGGEKMVIPLGETEEITLDKIIDTTETFKLGDDGIYAFKKKDNIDDVNIDVEAVDISIDDPEIDPILVEFGESTEIDPFKVELTNPTFAVDVADITVDQSKLPEIDLPITHSIEGFVPGLTLPEGSQMTSSNSQMISVGLEASTFEDIREVKEVYFGDGQTMQLVNISINTAEVKAMFKPGATQTLNDLQIVFPEGFVLAVYQDYGGALSVNQNVLTMKNVDMSADEQLDFQFYVEKFVHTFTLEDPEFEGELTFSINCGLEGTFVDTPVQNGSMKANLFVNGKFNFDKAAVITKDVDVDVESGSFNFEANVDGLEDLDVVKQITFKENSIFNLSINQLVLPFDFQESSHFVVEIPKILSVAPLSLPAGVRFDEASNCLLIKGSVLKQPGTEIQLTLKSIELDKYGKGQVVDGKIVINEELKYYAVSTVEGQEKHGQLVVQGGNIIFTDELSGMHRELVMTTDCGTGDTGMLEVQNALVVANAVSSDIDTDADFEVREEDMPEEVKILKEVYLENGGLAKFVLKVDFREMPKEIKKGISLAPLTVNLPKFILFAPNPDIDANNVMNLRETFVPSESNNFTYVKEFEVVGLDFTKIDDPQFANGLTIGDDHILSIPTEFSRVSVTGKVTTAAGEEVNSQNFEDFTIYPTVSVEDMTIGKVVGKVDPKIDRVEELVDLELDEDMDFLKNDSSELHIQNPLINVELKNTVGVPVTLDLNIAGYKQGASQPIEGSQIFASTATHPDFMLYPAVGKDTVTTHILISRQPVSMQKGDTYNKYVNVVIPELSNLLVHLPDQVKFTLDARADQSVDHEIDITPNFMEGGVEKARFLVMGDYDVTVPLVFEALNINYNDSIDNLNEDIWDFLDVAISAELDVNADLINQLPADLTLTAIAVDQMNNVLNTIDITVFIDGVEDGIINGVTAEGDQVTTPIKIQLKAKDTEELKKLDKLRLNVNAVISQTKNGVPLKAKQSVQLKNIKACVKKVNLDLN